MKVRVQIELLGPFADLNTPCVTATEVTLRGERPLERGHVSPGAISGEHARRCIVELDEHTDVILRLTVPPQFLNREE